jgi:hypothetical protein
MKRNFGWLVSLSTSLVYPDPEHRSAVTLWSVPSARNVAVPRRAGNTIGKKPLYSGAPFTR